MRRGSKKETDKGKSNNMPDTNTSATAPAPVAKTKSPLLIEAENYKPEVIDGAVLELGGEKVQLLLHKRYRAKIGKAAEALIPFYAPELTLDLVTKIHAEAELRAPNAGGQKFLRSLLLSLCEDATEYATVTAADGSTELDTPKYVEYLAVGGLRKSGPTVKELTDKINEINGLMVEIWGMTDLAKIAELYKVEASEEGKALKLYGLKKTADELHAQLEAKKAVAQKREAKKKAKKAEATPAAQA